MLKVKCFTTISILLLVCISILLLVCGVVFQPAFTLSSQDITEEDRRVYAGRLQLAADFLKANFNETLKLVCESPDNSEFSRTYWLVSDNLYTSYALQPYYPNTARKIDFQLRNVWNYNEDALHGILFNHRLAPIPIYGTEAVIIEEGPDNDGDGNPDFLIKTERLTSETLDVYDYADRLYYQALAAAFHGNLDQANQYLNQAVELWDGKGLADKIYKQQGYYETYKLAMLYYTAKVLGRLNDLEFKEDLLTTIFRLQAANGGFYTRYVWGEWGPEPYPGATTNTETTSLVIIALTYMPEIPALEQNKLVNSIITLFVGGNYFLFPAILFCEFAIFVSENFGGSS